MSAQYPQILEGHLDGILAGTLTEPEVLKTVLRTLLVIRRRYNDPDQVTGRRLTVTDLRTGDYEQTTPTTHDGCLGGVAFSNFWSIASQKARVEQGIAFLTPIIGAAVGDYPPAPGRSSTHPTIDSMGNNIPPGSP